MAKTRRRQMRLDGDVYSPGISVRYNDAPGIGLAGEEEYKAFLAQAAADGWVLESETRQKEEWWATYVKTVEVEEGGEGLYRLTGEYAGNCTGSVAASGEWVAFGLRGKETAVGVVRDGGEAGRLVVGPMNPRDERVTVAMDGGRLLAGAPGLGLMGVFDRRDGEWRKTGEIALGKRWVDSGFGAELAVQGDTAVMTGWLDGYASTFVMEKSGGAWEMAARFPGPDPRAGHAVALWEDWLVVGMGVETHIAGSVALFRKKAGRWGYAGMLDRSHLEGAVNFGAALAMRAGRLAVAGLGGTWLYRLAGSGWVLDGSVETGRVSGRDPVVLGEGWLAVGEPGVRGGTGQVNVFLEGEGRWTDAGPIVAADGEMGDGFGLGVAAKGGELVVGGKRSVRVYTREL